MPRYWGLDLHKRYVHAREWGDGNAKRAALPVSQRPGRLGAVCWPRTGPRVLGGPRGNRKCLRSARLAFATGGRVLLANPVELKRLGSGRHTDRVDAARLAEMLAMGILPTVWVPPPAVREVQRLLRYRHSLQLSRTRAYNEARAVLRRHGIHLPSCAELPEQLTEAHWRALPGGNRAILASAVAQVVRLGQELAALDGEILRRVASYPATTCFEPAWWRRPTSLRALTQVAWERPSVANSPSSGTRAVVALAHKLLVVAWRLMLCGDTYRAARTKTVRNKRRALQELQEQPLDWEARIRRLLAIGVEGSASRDRTRVPA